MERGVDGDQEIYWSSWDGQNWAPQQKIDGAGTSVGPSLTAFNNSPYAAWKGVDGDEKIYWSSAVPRQRDFLGVGVSLRSLNFPDKYIRHFFFWGFIASEGGSNPWDTTAFWRDDVSWVVSPPWAP